MNLDPRNYGLDVPSFISHIILESLPEQPSIGLLVVLPKAWHVKQQFLQPAGVASLLKLVLRWKVYQR